MRKKNMFIPIFYTKIHDLINHVLNKYVPGFLLVDVLMPKIFLPVLYVLDHVHKDYLPPKIFQSFKYSNINHFTSVKYGRLR